MAASASRHTVRASRGSMAPGSIFRARAPIEAILVHPWLGPALIAATCLVVFLLRLGAVPLLAPDEGRNAEIAREVLVSGNWLTPTIDFQPYTDKPMGFFWLAATSLKLFGINAWAARLPSAVAAILIVAFTTWWGSRYLDRLTGVLAGLILATAGLYVGVGRFVLLDMTLSLWVVTTMLYGGAWFLEGRRRGWPTWPVYALIGLGVLTKGPVAIALAVLTFGAFLLGGGRDVRVRELGLGRGAAVLLLVAGSWYAATAWLAPEYIWRFLWYHNIQRFTVGAGGHASNPFAYFYLLPIVFLPWGLYLPSIFVRARHAEVERPTRALELCTVWLSAVFLFFSLSRGKIATYVLPAFPALALLTAETLARSIRRQPLHRWERLNHRVAAAALVAIAIAGGVAAFVFTAVFAPRHLWLGLVPFAVLPFAVMALRNARRERFDLVLVQVFATAVLLYALFYSSAGPVLEHVYTLHEPALLLQSLPPDARILSLDSKAHSLRFYTGREVSSVADAPTAAARLSETAATALLAKREHLDAIRCALRQPVWVWWRGQRKKLLLVNQPPTGDGEKLEPGGCPR
jgi:4-amino-4-deoxy-L-arabinose transferase-like glycosyltransferase